MKSIVTTITSNVFLAVFLTVFTACHTDRRLGALEQSGENRTELEKVLIYYQDDEQKQQAAQFLLENMDAHYTLESPAISRFHQELDSLYTHHPKQDESFYARAYDVLLHAYNWSDEDENRLYDATTLTADYLTAHIDRAFEAWQSEWNNGYGFSHFCHYVLPYRIGHEPITAWNTYYAEKYKDKLANHHNRQRNRHYPLGIFDRLNRDYVLNTYYPKGDMPELPLTFLDRALINSCRGDAYRCVALLRSFGLPAAIDFTPQWGDRSKSHTWAVYLPDEERLFPFSGGEEIHTHFFNRPDGKLPKVFRRMYAKQEAMEEIATAKEEVPELFRNPCLMDVTNDYVAAYDVEVELFPEVSDRWVYLSVFDNRDWKIVHYAQRKGDWAKFVAMGSDMVYLPVCMDEYGETLPAGLPFILHTDGSVRTLQAHPTERESVELTRKYKPSDKLQRFCDAVTGGKFQVATRSDFSDSLTVAVIPPMTESRFHELTLNLEKPYPYFRYWAPLGTGGAMAELEVYDAAGRKLAPKRWFGLSEWHMPNLFDGDALTFYYGYAQGNIWAAVEFEEPAAPAVVRYLPRNDDNFIREGETYQLFYWDSEGWKLIKTLKGNREGVLRIDEVPRGALLWLRNRTKGNEERIFTYEDGKQVWW